MSPTVGLIWASAIAMRAVKGVLLAGRSGRLTRASAGNLSAPAGAESRRRSPGGAGMDRLQGMAAFLKVAELGSFSAAARQLGLSKSAVSKHVAALEERLGVRLINRTTRRLAL